MNTDDDCEKRLQRLREVHVAAVGGKAADLTKYVSSSRSCEADDEFDDEEEKSGDQETDPTDQPIDEEEEEGEEENKVRS